MPRQTTDLLHRQASWYKTSAALLAAAKTLWPKARLPIRRNRKIYPSDLRAFAQHGPAFLLLSAFAVENALKGTRVRQIRRAGGVLDVSNRGRGGANSNKVWGHDLPALAKSIGLQTDNLDDEMLNTLKRNIEWAGRYPAASGTGEWFIPRHGSDDLQRIIKLIRRIRKL